MPITFRCQHCQARMTVSDQAAGKRGKCSKCKRAVVVPSANGATAVPPPPVKPGTVNNKGEIVRAAPPVEDLETAALSALIDEPKKEEAKVSDFIEFICPQCDEHVKLPTEHAGKKHPCPSCRRIITVPRPAKKDPANWRDTGPSLPSAAKRDVGPMPDDIWGGARTGPSEESLREAGVIQEKHKPLTLLQRLRPYLIFAVPILLLIGGGLWGWHWWTQVTEKSALDAAIAAASSNKGAELVGSDGQAALNSHIGRYYRRSDRSGTASKARDEFSKAIARADRARNPERDGLLLDLLEEELSLAGSAEEVQSDTRRPIAQVQQLLAATLRAFGDHEAKLEGVRRVTALLLAKKESGRILHLMMQVFAGAEADRSEALAVVALELHKAGNKELAAEASKQALAPFPPPKDDKDKKDKKDKDKKDKDKKDKDKKEKASRPELRAAIVALAEVTGHPVPEAGKAENEREAVEIGKAMGLARKGKVAEARAAVAGNPDVTFRMKLEVAAATGEKDDINAAIDALNQVRGGRGKLGWAPLRLVALAQEAKLDADRLDAAVNAVPGALTGWGHLMQLRKRLEASRSVESLDVLEKFPAQSLAAKIARLELAWHNTRRDSGWARSIRGWDEGQKPFGSMGVALGLQGGK